MLFFFFIASIFPVSLFTTVIDGDRKITNEEQQLVNRVLAERYNTYYFHSDHLGSAQLITDWRGEEYERIEYTPYGELWIEKVRDGFETINYRFTGKEMDSETGLYYFGARYLDPKYSRWLSTDPALGDYVPQAPVNDEARKANGNLPGQGGLFNQVNFHLYHYAGNNPIRYIDPDGEAPVKPNAHIGQQAHTFFEDSLTIILVGEQYASNRAAYTDRPLNRILNSLYQLFGINARNQSILENQDPVVDELSNPQKRPDLVVRNDVEKTLSVYELKPESSMSGYKNEKAKNQLNGYISQLRKNSSGYAVKGGTDIPGRLTLPYPQVGEKGTITFTADPYTKGLYYYSIDDGLNNE